MPTNKPRFAKGTRVGSIRGCGSVSISFPGRLTHFLHSLHYRTVLVASASVSVTHNITTVDIPSALLL